MITRKIVSRTLAVLLTTGVLIISGCGREDATQSTSNNTVPSLPGSYFLASAPGGVQPIATLKQAAKQGDEVVVRAVVGGSVAPIVEGRASLTIVDTAQSNPCLSGDDHCKTPWDYCCSPREELSAHLATLQVVEPNGRVKAADLSDRIQPLSILVVRGVVGPRPDAQVLTINATGIFVEPTEQP